MTCHDHDLSRPWFVTTMTCLPEWKYFRHVECKWVHFWVRWCTDLLFATWIQFNKWYKILRRWTLALERTGTRPSPGLIFLGLFTYTGTECKKRLQRLPRLNHLLGSRRTHCRNLRWKVGILGRSCSEHCCNPVKSCELCSGLPVPCRDENSQRLR